ncbi:MAG: glycosyltransferase [Lentisphaeria bacterium]
MDSRTDKARRHLKNGDGKLLLSLVLPVYNEGSNITAVLEKIAEQVHHPLIVILVYDQNDDNTLPAARKTAENLPFQVILLKNKYGKGALNAIKTGMEYAESKFVVVTMADLSDPPAVINDMLEAAQQQNADIVCASRYMRGGRQYGAPLLKSSLSRLAGNTLYYLAGLPTHDPTNSFKLYRKTMLKQIPIKSDGGFELGIELVVKAREKKFSITEVPTSWEDRQTGMSNFKFKQWLPKYLKWFLRAFCCKQALQRILMITVILLLFALAAREFLALHK